MKKNELEHRLAELLELRESIEKTIQTTVEDAKKSEITKEDSLRVLGDVFSFARETIESASKVKEEDRLKFFEGALQKMRSWSQAEIDRIKSRPQILQERLASLQSINGFLIDRSKSHEARIAAIDRAADPNRDKRHPEKLSTKRAAISQIDEDQDD